MEHEEFSREPRSTTEARRAITETRSRISEDLDAIEDRIVEKREELKAKVDVLTPARRRIRERPWPMLAVALGTGFVLGAIGGDEEEEAEPVAEERREERRRYRAERRERLRSRRREARERKSARADGRFGSSTAGMLGGAVVSGLTARLKRFGRDVLAGRR